MLNEILGKTTKDLIVISVKYLISFTLIKLGFICNRCFSYINLNLRNTPYHTLINSFSSDLQCLGRISRYDSIFQSNQCYHVMRSAKLTTIDLTEWITANGMLKRDVRKSFCDNTRY